MAQRRRLRQVSTQLRPCGSSGPSELLQDMFGALDIPHRRQQQDLLPIRFSPSSAAWRLGGLLPPPAGAMQQRMHTYYRDTSGAVSAGLWEVRGAVLDVPIPSGDRDLFLMLLPSSVGRVTLTCSATGEVLEATAGQAIVLPQDAEYTWRQAADTVVVAAFEAFNPALAPSSSSSAKQQPPAAVSLLATVADGRDAAAAVDTSAADTSRYIGTIPTQHSKRLHNDRTGQMVAVLWDTTTMVRKTPLFEPFIYKNEHFTKTGSGQT
jgi:uncharacterized cupin superfamily protein